MQLKLGNTLFPHTELINFCAYPFECKYCTKEIEAQKKTMDKHKCTQIIQLVLCQIYRIYEKF